MYYVKCRQKTETLNPKEHLTRYNRQILKGQCVVCGITKSGGFANTILNSGVLPEMHIPG